LRRTTGCENALANYINYDITLVTFHEIRLRDAGGAFRVTYIAALADAIHVLHAFQKKTQKTAQRDLDLAAARLHKLKRGLK
jgi:phage-related protein